METNVNLWAVLLAAVSSMVVGGFWYAKGVFGNMWMKLVKLDEKRMAEKAGPSMVMAFFISLLTAFVLAHLIDIVHSFYLNSYLMDALTTGLWVWVGLIATRMITHDLFEQRRKKLTLLNISNELLTIIGMSLVIGLVR